MVEYIKTALLILTIGSTAITTILTLFSKGQINKKEKIVELAKIVQKLPEYIETAEQMFGSGKGKVKKQYVLNEVRNECLLNEVDFKSEEFSEEIEKILATPQKKEN